MKPEQRRSDSEAESHDEAGRTPSPQWMAQIAAANQFFDSSDFRDLYSLSDREQMTRSVADADQYRRHGGDADAVRKGLLLSIEKVRAAGLSSAHGGDAFEKLAEMCGVQTR